MSKKFIETSIGSYENRLKALQAEIREAVDEGMYALAAMRCADAEGYKWAIRELETQLDNIEYESKFGEYEG